MADDEKLISSALQIVFKSAKIPAELYEKKQFELKVDESEVVKVNMTLKRGLVLDIEDDSHFRAYLNIGDIVLTVNDKVAAKPDFKLQDLFKERGCKSFAFTYVRMKCAIDDKPAIDDSERRDGYDYRVFALFHFQRVPMGLIMQSFQGSKVMVMDVAVKTIGAMCLLAGDIILQINGVRQGNDAAKTLETMANEIEQKGFARITVERPMSDVAKATARFTIETEHRDLPVPADCAAYIKDALKLLKGPEPKSIMKSRATSEESHVSVGFHERIHAESVIPSDIADELLVKTPNRVPGVTVPPVVLPPPPPQPVSAEPSEDKVPSVMGMMAKAPPSVDGPPPPIPTTPIKEAKKASATKASKKGSGSNSKASRKKGSSEPVASGKSGKALGGGGGTAEKAHSKSKTKKKSGKKDRTQTGGDTEHSRDCG